ncbi:hypothetical protein BP6252_03507 [Coleophoma cylindrospora]|uniref:PEBP-like protein n=1 Tax=Coleophoma cylindrospora TaxID=1849047 RepID=A0A3D8S7U4_9HELO|nr:hypothetical protein BP6252_03507 [Coleophoma cylindrospora]
MAPSTGVLKYVEYTASLLFQNVKGHDVGLFIKSPAFTNDAKLAKPTIVITSPDCGPSPAKLNVEYTQFYDPPTAVKMPSLSWDLPADIQENVKEYVLLCEDPDAPSFSKTPSLHGLWYGISGNARSVRPEDFVVKEESEGGPCSLQGGFRLGKNRRGTVYTPPRPLLEHGPHRYFFQLVALKEPLELEGLSPRATKAELEKECAGKILAWGVWEGSFENKW